MSEKGISPLSLMSRVLIKIMHDGNLFYNIYILNKKSLSGVDQDWPADVCGWFFFYFKDDCPDSCLSVFAFVFLSCSVVVIFLCVRVRE